jgi:hypothetical protein
VTANYLSEPGGGEQEENRRGPFPPNPAAKRRLLEADFVLAGGALAPPQNQSSLGLRETNRRENERPKGRDSLGSVRGSPVLRTQHAPCALILRPDVGRLASASRIRLLLFVPLDFFHQTTKLGFLLFRQISDADGSEPVS